MPTIRIPLVGDAYSTRSLAVGAQTCINLYPEIIESPTEKNKNDAVLYGSPGFNAFVDMGAIDAGFNPLRGAWSGDGRLFVIGGTKYCEINPTTGALIGSVRTVSNAAVNGLANAPGQIYPNGNQLLILSGGLAYIDNGSGPVPVSFGAFTGLVSTNGVLVVLESGDPFDPTMQGQPIVINGLAYTVQSYLSPSTLLLTTTAGMQTSASYGATPSMTAMTGGYLDGYYLVGRPNSRQYNTSSLNNSTGAVWSGLDFSTKNSYPDNLNCLLAADDVYLFGEDTTDVHRNTGGTFPFTKMDGASFRLGAASPWAPIQINNRVFFMGVSSQGRVVAYVLDGYTPVRISTHAEEYQWAAANLGANCISYSEEHEGHYWWVINFGSQTWQYDLVSGAWSQRCFWNGTVFSALPFQFHTYVPEVGKHFVGGNNSSILYTTGLDLYTQSLGGDFSWERTLPHMYAQGKNQYFGRMTMEMQTGATPSGTPVITRTWSDDRGQTFGHPETASIGSAGQYSLRVFWPSTSCSRDRVYRISGVGKGLVAIIAIYQEYEVGRS